MKAWIMVFFIIVIIVGILVMNQTYISYKTVSLKDQTVIFCENGSMKSRMGDIGQLAFQAYAGTLCIDYKTSRCVPVCENEVPSCRCEATILDRLLSHPGEYLMR